MNVQHLNIGMQVAIKYGKWDNRPEKAEIVSLQYDREARHKVRFLTGDKAGQTEEVTSRAIWKVWSAEQEEEAQAREFERKKQELAKEWKRQELERSKLRAEEVAGYLALLGAKVQIKSNVYRSDSGEDAWVIWITNATEIADLLREIATKHVQS